MAADKSPSKKNSQALDRPPYWAYARYIRQLVGDWKVCKIVTDMYVLSFINPLLPGVPDLEQHELCSITVEITRAVER